MFSLTHSMNQGTLTLALEGSISSANAPEAGRALDQVIKENKPRALVFDCEKLTYLSSAGLRLILSAKKAVPATKLLNVSPEVYEIFDMTGFTELMEVHKAYRKISVAGCQVIGAGANGQVYRINPDTMVKVYRNPDSLDEIQRERELARTAFVLGVPTAIPYDVVQIQEGGYGSVFELLNATSYAELLKTGQKTIPEIAEMSASLLRTIHATEVKPGSIPNMREVALGWMTILDTALPPEHAEKLRSLLAAVPESLHMLHGDFHIKNVMLQNGESLLIDMDTLCCGHPIFELGTMFTSHIAATEVEVDNVLRFFGLPREDLAALWHQTLRLYLGDGDEARLRAVEEKAMVLGYARLLRRCIRRSSRVVMAQENIAHCQERLAELLPRVDSLEF